MNSNQGGVCGGETKSRCLYSANREAQAKHILIVPFSFHRSIQVPDVAMREEEEIIF